MKKDVWNIEVTDRKSFQEFLRLLLKDYENNHGSWENNRLDLFLEALQGYTGDLPGYYQNNGPEIDADVPSWKKFADILLGAVVYE